MGIQHKSLTGAASLKSGASNYSLTFLGIFFAVIASVSFGTNPLFALPLYARGFDVNTVLFVRYVPAAVVLGGVLLLGEQRLRLTFKEFLGCMICSVLFAMTSQFLFLSYTRMDAGIASTLLFVYPIIVVPIMVIWFHEKPTWKVLFCIVLSCAGVGVLCRTSGGKLLDFRGILYALLSAFFFALYLVAGTQLRWIARLKPEVLVFYVILGCLIFFLLRLDGGVAFKGRVDMAACLNILGLSLVSTALSIGCTSLALPRIGATPTSIIGALEPLTAVFFGVVIFHETMTWRIGFGIALILASVIILAFRRGSPKYALF